MTANYCKCIPVQDFLRQISEYWLKRMFFLLQSKNVRRFLPTSTYFQNSKYATVSTTHLGSREMMIVPWFCSEFLPCTVTKWKTWYNTLKTMQIDIFSTKVHWFPCFIQVGDPWLSYPVSWPLTHTLKSLHFARAHTRFVQKTSPAILYSFNHARLSMVICTCHIVPVFFFFSLFVV